MKKSKWQLKMQFALVLVVDRLFFNPFLILHCRFSFLSLLFSFAGLMTHGAHLER